jgi:hypothetical protein
MIPRARAVSLIERSIPMATTNNKTINTWDWDVRVRERNVRKGILDDKDIEKHLSALPDKAEEAEPINVASPALGGRQD